MVTFATYFFVLGVVLSQGLPILGCPQQQDASLHLFTGASVQRKGDSPCLPSLTSAFPCRQASPVTQGSDFLPSVIPVTSCIWYSRAWRGEEAWHWARAGHLLHWGKLFSEGPWKVPSCVMVHEALPDSWGRTCLWDEGLLPMV